jgi:hypothetical protein
LITGIGPACNLERHMKSLIASVMVSAAMAAGLAAPVLAQEAKHTQLVDDKGATVDSLLMRYALEATWVIDNQRILIRDAHRDHYLISLKDKCEELDKDRSFVFFPALTNRVRASLHYEVRSKVGPYCDIGKIEQINSAAAASLRAELANKG